MRILNAHLPFGNTVYWDAGISYDRYNQNCTSSSQWYGRWNNWVFVKNANTGAMSIYLNGAYWGGRGGATLGVPAGALRLALFAPFDHRRPCNSGFS